MSVALNLRQTDVGFEMGKRPALRGFVVGLGSQATPDLYSNLSVSIDNGEHSTYFRKNVRGNENTHVVEFDVPKWLDNFMKENVIDQNNYWKNPYNMGGTAPKRVDLTKPGKAYELPHPWVEWLEEYATNGHIVW